MAVLEPLKLTITNWPVDSDGTAHVEWMDVVNNPEDDAAGTRSVPFTGELWIEQDDFKADPPPKYFRLTPGREVRLRNAFFVTATEAVLDDDGNVVEVLATYDPETLGGNAPDTFLEPFGLIAQEVVQAGGGGGLALCLLEQEHHDLLTHFDQAPLVMLHFLPGQEQVLGQAPRQEGAGLVHRHDLQVGHFAWLWSLRGVPTPSHWGQNTIIGRAGVLHGDSFSRPPG